MKKPIIGIVSKPKIKKPDGIWNKMYIADDLRYLIIKNGGIPIAILPTEKTTEFNQDDSKDNRQLTDEEKNDLYDLIDLCGGIVLQGGVSSCSYEIEIAKRVIELDKPILGICAGFNNLLRAIGSDVLSDKTGSHNHLDIEYRHHIKINKDSKLYNIIHQEDIQVNSIHSMIATKELVEPYAKITSYSDDETIESFELPDKRFVMGIKWHPELMQDESYTDALFAKLIESSK